jgi:hypothetical protein
MIEFLCLPHTAPFCAATEYGPTVHVGSLDYQGGLFDRSVPADQDVQARLGVEVDFGFPDVGRRAASSDVREICVDDRCVGFVVRCEPVALTCTWDMAGRGSNGDYVMFSFISVKAVSRQSMTSALQNLALDLGEGIRLPLAATVDASQASAD